MEKEITELLSQLVAFDTSINPHEDQYPGDECALFVEQYGREHGFSILPVPDCEFQGNRIFPVILYKKSEVKGPTVLFLGHLDVVPVSQAELSDWHSDPFTATTVDNKIYGRGAGDMKSGVAAFLLAFKDFQPENGTVIIALSGDEEIGGTASVPKMIEQLEKSGLTPDFVINAESSGYPALVTKRRGGTQIEFSFALDLHKSHGALKTKTFISSLSDGSQSLHSMSFVLGADIHAMIAAGKFCIDKKIVSVSSSSVKNNSVPKEVVVTYLESSPEQSHKLQEYSIGLSKLMAALATVGSITWPVVPSKYGPAVCPNLLQLNVDENIGKIIFDIRSMLKSSKSHDEIAELLTTHFNNYDLTTDFKFKLRIDPVDVDPTGSFPKLVKSISESLGFIPEIVGEKLGGASDTRFFTSIGIPGIELGPLGYNMHGMNEATDIKSVAQLIVIYREIFNRLTSDKQ